MGGDGLKYALIGCGRIAVNHVKAALENGMTLAAVCDICPEKMERLLGLYGLSGDMSIKRYTDYRALLTESAPDIAAVATDSGSHARIALGCIGRRVNVIIEKPMAMSMEDADEIVRRADDKGVVVSVCHQNRFNEAVMRTRRALEAGRLGRLSHGCVHVRWNRGDDYYAQAPWRGTWAGDGGVLMNQCIHGIDLLCWMMGGDPYEVYGVTRRRFHRNIEAEDVGLAIVKFKSGAVATIEGTTNVYPQNLEETLYLFGEKGTVKLGGKSVNRIDVWAFSDATEADRANEGFEEKTANVYGNGHTALYRDVAEAVRNGRRPHVDARAGRAAVELVLAIYKSQRDGVPVRLPLYSFSSADMAGTF